MVVQFILDKLENCEIEDHSHFMPEFYKIIVGYGIGSVSILGKGQYSSFIVLEYYSG